MRIRIAQLEASEWQLYQYVGLSSAFLPHQSLTFTNSGRRSLGLHLSRLTSLASSLTGRTKVKQSRSGNRRLMESRICRLRNATGLSGYKFGG